MVKGMLDGIHIRHLPLLGIRNAKPSIQHQFLCGSNNLALHDHTEILGHNFPLSLSEEDKAPQKIHCHREDPNSIP